RLQCDCAWSGVAQGAAAAFRMKQLVLRRIEDDADFRARFFDIRNRHVPIRNAAQKIVGAINGIDDPAAIERPGETRRGFFAEKPIVRKRRCELDANQLLDFAIGDADKIAGTLELDDELLASIPEVERKGAGLACE